jgi:cytoskeletal protein CcmA (bactofilin family)
MRGMYDGTVTIEGRFTGIVNGTAIVPAGADAEIRGMINGTLIAERGSRVHVTGMVNGAIVNRGGSITRSGMMGG